MTVVIPVDLTRSSTIIEQVELDKASYTLRFRWNARGKALFLDISDTDGPILKGIRVVRDYDLLEMYTSPRRPPGTLRLVDRRDDPLSGDVTPESVGERFLLAYTER